MSDKFLNYYKEHKKMFYIAGIGILSSYMILSLVFSDLGLFKYFSIKSEYKHIKKDITRLKSENDLLRGEVESLKKDPDYIESLARKRLGLVKKGELIYKFADTEEKDGSEGNSMKSKGK